MRRVLTLLLISLLFLSATAAVTVNGQQVDPQDIGQQDIDEAVQKYNQDYADQVPGLVRSIVSGERINVNISTQDGHLVFGAVMDGMTITRVEEGGIEDPTLRVYTSTGTLKTIAEAENPRKRAVQEFRGGGIRYETAGFFRSIKFGIVSTLLKVFG